VRCIKPRLAEDKRIQKLRQELRRRRMRAYVTGAYLEHFERQLNLSSRAIPWKNCILSLQRW
jgi:hypothetical protein